MVEFIRHTTCMTDSGQKAFCPESFFLLVRSVTPRRAPRKCDSKKVLVALAGCLVSKLTQALANTDVGYEEIYMGYRYERLLRPCDMTFKGAPLGAHRHALRGHRSPTLAPHAPCPLASSPGRNHRLRAMQAQRGAHFRSPRAHTAA